MFPHELFELADQPAVETECKIGVDAQFRRDDAGLGQPRDRRLRELVIREVTQRGPAPQAQRLVEEVPRTIDLASAHRLPPARGQLLEAEDVDCRSLDDKDVADAAP